MCQKVERIIRTKRRTNQWFEIIGRNEQNYWVTHAMRFKNYHILFIGLGNNSIIIAIYSVNWPSTSDRIISSNFTKISSKKAFNNVRYLFFENFFNSLFWGNLKTTNYWSHCDRWEILFHLRKSQIHWSYNFQTLLELAW